MSTANKNHSLKDQYLALLQIYDNEQSRFWTRFNIFIGFQTALIIGILSANKFLFSNPFILEKVVFIGLILSLLGILVNVRSISINNEILKTLFVLEKLSNGELIVLKTYRTISNIPLYINGIITLVIDIIILMFWFVIYFRFDFIMQNIVLCN